MGRPGSPSLFDRLFTIALLAMVLVPVGRRFPLAALGLLGGAAFLWWQVLRTRRAIERQGFEVEYLSPGVLRGAEDEFAIAYHEGPNVVYFSGTVGRRGHRDQLVLPGTTAWDERVEPFARGRRDEIVGRIREDPLVAKRVDLVEG